MRKLKNALAAGAAVATVAAPHLAMAAAAALSGSVDPTTGLGTVGSWFLGLAGVGIPIICAFKGTHAVAQGQHLMPYIGGAIGGSALCFGGSYILANY